MSNPKWEEQIIVVKRAELFNGEEDAFQGVLTDENTIYKIAGQFENFEVMRRGHAADPTPAENNAEINFEYKQPIPYVVVRRGNEVFTYKRLAGGGETRLFDKISIGIGGHMNKEEGLDSFGENVFENMIRELEEELEIDAEGIVIKTLGLINDDNDDVGKVHIGILMVADIEEGSNVTVRETEQLDGEWVTVEQLEKSDAYDLLENWSKLALTTLK